MSPLTLKLLGVFQLIDGENTMTLGQARLPELVAYLALRRFEAVPRRQLAYLFWPDSSEAQAQTNLRNLLFKLGKAWPTVSNFLHVERSQIRWRADCAVEIDVLRFEAAVAQADAASQLPAVESALQEALACYGGDLLPSCYDDWILVERERLNTIFLRTLERLALLLEDQRRYDEAIVQAQRLLQADPLQESSYHHLMRLYAATGDRAAALRIYHTCLSLLERELAAPPSAATQQLYNRLLNLDQSAPGQPAPLAHNTPMVGRQREWKQLLSAWQEAHQGRARLVVISGEAGIGKTRLAEELVDKAAHQGYTTASSRAYAAEGALSYAPVSEWLHRPPVRQAVERIEPIWQVEIARLLPEILHEHPELPAPGPLSEGWQRQRFFEGVVRCFLALPQPLLFHLDDLQWCDEETLTLLHYLLRSARTARLMLVGTVRSEEVDASHPLSRVLAMLRQDDLLREIELGPLSAEESAALATQASGEAISDGMQADLYRQSEGHPLFLIEMIRMRDTDGGPQTADGAAEDSGRAQTAQPLSSPSGIFASLLPPKIQAVISVRLGQLSSQARELAQLAAVVGREFSFPLLLAASSADEESLVMALDELWRRRIVREQANGYDFSHDRIREVAYAGISQVRRQFYHQRVAEALKKSSRESLDASSGQLAFHYEASGNLEQAVAFYLRAGEYTLSTYASDRGFHYFEKALALTTQSERRAAALSGLGRAAFALDRLDTAIDYFQQALDLSQEGSPSWPKLLYWLADAHFARYHPEAAEPFVLRALAAAEALDDKETHCQALSLLGQIESHRGNLAAEEQLIQRALMLTRETGNRWREGRTLADLGFLQAQCGDFAAAAASARQAIEHLQGTQDLAAQSFAWNILGRAEGGRGRYDAAFAAFERCEALANEIDLHSLLVQIPNMRGWLCQQLCDYQSAHRFNNQGLEIALQWKKDTAEISARLNLCLDAVYLARPQEAYETLGALERRLEQNDFGFHGWRWRLRLWHIEGLALVALGSPDESLTLAAQGMQLAQRTTAAKYIALNHELCAQAHTALGDEKSAISELENALHLADQMVYQPLRWQGRRRLAALYSAGGDDPRAALLTEQADQIIEKIAADLTDPHRRQTFLSTVRTSP
jgi:DNA-binding SARP family transcriptional activator